MAGAEGQPALLRCLRRIVHFYEHPRLAVAVGAPATFALRSVPLALHRPRHASPGPPCLRPRLQSAVHNSQFTIRHCSLFIELLFIAHCPLPAYPGRHPLHLSALGLLPYGAPPDGAGRPPVRERKPTGGGGPAGVVFPDLGAAAAGGIAVGGAIRRRRGNRPPRRGRPAGRGRRPGSRLQPQPRPAGGGIPGPLPRPLPDLLFPRLAGRGGRGAGGSDRHRARGPDLIRRARRPPHSHRPLRRDLPAPGRRCNLPPQPRHPRRLTYPPSSQSHTTQPAIRDCSLVIVH